MGQKIVVIGGVACGPKAAARARRRDPEAEITIIERQEYISYASCGLPYYLAGVVPELNQLLSLSFGALRDPRFFNEVKDIEVLTRTEALAIDRDKKRVRIRSLAGNEERDLNYDQLVLATGARPKRPTVPGLDLEGVYHLWTLPDAVALRERIEAGQVERVCIVGAGLIGLEAAEALVNQAVEVSIIEFMPYVLSGQLDPEMAALVEDGLREAKVALFCGEAVTEIVGFEGKVKKVVSDRRELEVDAVLLAAGAEPDTRLATACGLALGETGAIRVDEHLRTSDPFIFAGGDGVENIHLVSGQKVWVPLGSIANLHGRVIGNNLTGEKDSFPGILGTGIMKVMGLNVAYTGLTETKARQLGYETASALGPFNDKSHYYPGGKNLVIKLVADNRTGKVLGLQVAGPGDAARIVDTGAAALRFHATLDELANIDFAYAPPFGIPIEPLAQTANILRNKRHGLGRGTHPLALQQLLAGNDDFIILDVRSQGEREARPPIADPRVRAIDLFQVRKEIDRLPKDKPLIALCQVGQRAFDVQCALTGAGFKQASYLEGGLNVFLRLGNQKS
jgi:NADPH-dependent 2,4-dienoyl-CoA reductase/sulfur reductase-like enzyme/rhodanese-related sulfurtransferase